MKIAISKSALKALGRLPAEDRPAVGEAANRAKIRAEITPEYARKREARDTKELVVELVRSLKYFLRCKEDEVRLTR